MIKTIATCLALAASTSAALAQTSSFTPDSLGELRRIYGTAPPPPAAAVAQQRVQDFTTLTAKLATPGKSAIQTFVDLNDVATPSTIDSIGLLAALQSPTSDPVYLLLWHQIALDATAVDFSAGPNASPRHQEQPGPPRAARALAAIHLAMFEAANLFDQRYKSFFTATATLSAANASRDAAIVEAAYKTMVWLYPGLDIRIASDGKTLPNLDCKNLQGAKDLLSLQAYHQCSLERLGATDPATLRGQDLGTVVADLVIANRLTDQSNLAEPSFDKDSVLPKPTDPPNPAQWTVDPVSTLMIQLGGRWGSVTPFAPGIDKSLYPDPKSHFTLKDPTKLDSLPTYDVVRTFGLETRFGTGNNAQPQHDGLFVTQFWAYDGTANLCAPPRLYNQVALAALGHLETTASDGTATKLDPASTTDVARYFALVNVGMSDAAIAAWGAKYTFQFARPITYIRAADDQAVPAGTEATRPLWLPIGAQNTNAAKPFNITPPFPSYPSGHAVFGGAVFGVMRQFMQPAATFSFRSDEFNGHNRDAFNYIRCNPASDDNITPSLFCGRRDLTIDCAERENADSRVFMGVHWLFDADDGITLGNRVAKQDFSLLQRVGIPDKPGSFSVADAQTTRAKLLCSGVRYPLGWEDKFGPLAITTVD